MGPRYVYPSKVVPQARCSGHRLTPAAGCSQRAPGAPGAPPAAARGRSAPLPPGSGAAAARPRPGSLAGRRIWEAVPSSGGGAARAPFRALAGPCVWRGLPGPLGGASGERRLLGLCPQGRRRGVPLRRARGRRHTRNFHGFDNEDGLLDPPPVLHQAAIYLQGLEYIS